MQCPHCQKPLGPVTFQGVTIDVCPGCGGTWLGAGELGSIVEARQARFTKEEAVAVAHAAVITGVKLTDSDRSLACPNCGAKTHPVNYGDDSGIIIDECSACGGVWLDKGELDKIEELVEGWDDELPDDLARFGPKMRQVAADVDQYETVHISHFRFINALINRVLDVLGD
jgi:Zn-finger nucleic acid-binding protein